MGCRNLHELVCEFNCQSFKLDNKVLPCIYYLCIQNRFRKWLSLPPTLSFPDVSTGNPDVHYEVDWAILAKVWIPAYGMRE